MKITCPNCEATYEVPEAVLTARRPVRCVRCAKDWVPGGETEDEAAPATAQPPTESLAVAETADAAPVAETLAPAEPEQEPEPHAEPEPELEPAPAPEPAGPLETEPLAATEAAPLLHVPVPPPPAPPPPEPKRPVRSVVAAVPPPLGDYSPLEFEPRQPVLAWVASIALLLLVAIAGIGFRGTVMHTWPASTRLYAAMGYHATP